MTSNLKSAANAPATEPCRWIIAVAQTQDRQSFERLFLRFAPKLKSYFLRYGWEDALAEDMAQDVLLAVWRKAIQFDSAGHRPGLDLRHRPQSAHRSRAAGAAHPTPTYRRMAARRT
jgi:hypothetical protein